MSKISFQNWYADSPVASFLRSLFSIVIVLAVADWAKAGTFDFTNWQLWLITALTSLLSPLSRKANPQDSL